MYVAKFIAKRVMTSILVIFLVSLFAFSLMHVLPGDPVVVILGEGATQKEVDEARAKFNLDQPILVQYYRWARGILTRWDFGTSLMYKEDVGVLIKEKLPVTMAVGIPAFVISALVGILFGIISAIKRGTRLDQLVSTIANVSVGVPIFWVAILGIYLFAMKLRVLPIQGFVSPMDDFGAYLEHAVLPVTCMSIGFIAIVTRQTRSNMLEVINLDYIRTARAYGLPESKITMRHALKNAMIPVITIIALQVRIIVGGSVIIERIFNIPGVGSLLMRAILNRDYLIVQACVLLMSLVTVGCNLFVEILYGFIDPRIRKSWR